MLVICIIRRQRYAYVFVNSQYFDRFTVTVGLISTTLHVIQMIRNRLRRARGEEIPAPRHTHCKTDEEAQIDSGRSFKSGSPASLFTDVEGSPGKGAPQHKSPTTPSSGRTSLSKGVPGAKPSSTNGTLTERNDHKSVSASSTASGGHKTEHAENVSKSAGSQKTKITPRSTSVDNNPPRPRSAFKATTPRPVTAKKTATTSSRPGTAKNIAVKAT